jgi:carbon-monoxide dehydrogenase small subunit
MRDIVIQVNGTERRLQVDDHELLVDVLRQRLRLTGAHVACDTTQCGCCTVHVDGRAVKSCTMLAVQADGRVITTIEGLADGDRLHPLQTAFSQQHALQCGFCTPGMIMAAAALLAEDPHPDARAIAHGLEGNLCRCTGYVNIVDAVACCAAGGT